MKIIVGSKNKAKVKAVERVFTSDEVIATDVASYVSTQPFSDKETLTGAINRAQEAHKGDTTALGMGLEGGVTPFNNQLFLISWGALIDQNDQLYVAGGARIPLPEEIVVQLNSGVELGVIVDKYTQKQGVRHKEGTIGVLTNDLVSRSEMFAHIVRQLRGQYLFKTKLN